MNRPDGYFEGLSGRVASGWVTSRDHPDVSLVVQIEIDRQVIAHIVADVPRADVAARRPGTFYCGFEYVVPNRYADGKPHAIRVLTMGQRPLGQTLCFQLLPAGESEQYSALDPADVDLVEVHGPGETYGLAEIREPGETGGPLPELAGRLQLSFEATGPVARPLPWAELGQSDDEVGASPFHRQFRSAPNYCFIATRQLVNAEHGICYTETGKPLAITGYLRSSDVTDQDGEMIRRRRDAIVRLPGRYILFSSTMKDNYFHWHLDCMAAIHLLRRRLGADWRPLCGVLSPWQAESLRMLGYDDVEQHSGLFEVEQVAGTGYLDGRGIAPDSNVAEMFFYLKGRIAASEPDDGQRKLFISRSDSNRRVTPNEDELWQLLEKRGFRRLVLSELRYTEQAALFLNADVVVAAHGAGLTNIGYCRTGATIIEIIPRNYINNPFRNLAIRCGLRHFWYAIGSGDTLTIDIDDFGEHLKRWAS